MESQIISDVTIIIPFKNEKFIWYTLDSIKKRCSNCEIIVINDLSDDGVDYASVANYDYDGVRYYVNSTPLGVAATRDLGVSLATKSNIIFLDAHMRLQSDIVIEFQNLLELESNNKTLFCAQTRQASDVDGRVFIDGDKPYTRAARAQMVISDKMWATEWVYLEEGEDQLDEIEVPMVLGACYAIKKEFYNYLHGLKGLDSYGMDEQLLSTKVWLAGGKCILLPKMIVSHVYRKFFPYLFDTNMMKSNELFLTRLFFPELEAELVEKGVYPASIVTYLDSKSVFVEAEKEYLESIFVRDAEFVFNLNKPK